MYIAFLGTMKAGAVSALMNHNLRLNAFTHCFSLAKSKFLIFQSDLGPAIMEPIRAELEASGNLYQFSLEGKEVASYDRIDLRHVDEIDRCADRRKGVKMGDAMSGCLRSRLGFSSKLNGRNLPFCFQP